MMSGRLRNRVAGTWYPVDAVKLDRDVDSHLGRGRSRCVDVLVELTALIAPHAGRIFSVVAAHAYRPAARPCVRRRAVSSAIAFSRLRSFLSVRSSGLRDAILPRADRCECAAHCRSHPLGTSIHCACPRALARCTAFLAHPRPLRRRSVPLLVCHQRAATATSLGAALASRRCAAEGVC